MTGDEEPSWTQISDNDLEKIVQGIQELTPNIGQARLLGALRSRGLNIQRWRVRNSPFTLDPIGKHCGGVQRFTGENTVFQLQTLCGILTVITNLSGGG